MKRAIFLLLAFGAITWLPVKAALPGTSQYSVLWTNAFDAGATDRTEDMVIDSSGNLYVAGASQGRETDLDGVLLKFDSKGAQKWIVRIDGTRHWTDQLTAIALDRSGNPVVTGFRADHGAGIFALYTAKFDALGSNLWQHTFSTAQNTDQGHAIAVDLAGNVVVTGIAITPMGTAMVVLKYTAEGELAWTNALNNTLPSGESQKTRLAVGADGSIYLASRGVEHGSDVDWLVVKYSAEGKQLWTRYMHGPNPGKDGDVLAKMDGSGNLVLAGTTLNSEGFRNIKIAKLSPAGDTLWVTQFESATDYVSNALAISSANEIIVAGDTSAPYPRHVILKYAPTGERIWANHLPFGLTSGVDIDSSGKILVSCSVYLAVIDPDGACNWGITLKASGFSLFGPESGFYFAGTQLSGGGTGSDIVAGRFEEKTIAEYPKVTGTPADQLANFGSIIRLEASATGENPLTYSWILNGVPLSGEQTNWLQTTPLPSVGTYQFLVTNRLGFAFTRDIQVQLAAPYVLVTTNEFLVSGGDAALTAAVFGARPLAYQWYRYNNFLGYVPLTGETNSKLLIRHASLADIGYYAVRATNQFGFMDSVPALLRVPPTTQVREVWRKTMGGPQDLTPSALRLTQDGVLISASAADGGQNKTYLLDSSGLEKSAVAHAFIKNILAVNPPVAIDPAGNAFVIGVLGDFDHLFDWKLAKMSASGGALWQRSFGSAGLGFDAPMDLVMTGEDVVVIGTAYGGPTGTDLVASKFSGSDGRLIWTARYNDSAGVANAGLELGGDWPIQTAADARGNIYVLGYSFNAGGNSYVLLKYDLNGKQQWLLKFPPGPGGIILGSLALDSAGNGYVLFDQGMAKFSPDGGWIGAVPFAPFVRANLHTVMTLDSQGNQYYVATGPTGNRLEKRSPFGELLYSAELQFIQVENIAVDEFGNAYAVGTEGRIRSDYDMVVLKVDNMGLWRWKTRLDGLGRGQDQGLFIAIRNGTDIYVAGRSWMGDHSELTVARYEQVPFGGFPSVRNTLGAITAVLGETVTLQSEVFGSGPISLQWLQNGSLVFGAGSKSLTLRNVGFAQAGHYSLIAVNFYGGEVSSGVSLRVVQKPIVTRPPISREAVIHGEAQFSVETSGTPPLSYQWLFEGEPILDATNMTLIVSNVEHVLQGEYSVRVTNEWGGVTSTPATLKLSPVANLPPTIELTSPADQRTFRFGDSILIEAGAFDPDDGVERVDFFRDDVLSGSDSTAPFEYQWTPAEPGGYLLSAVAVDRRGQTRRSSLIKIFVNSAVQITRLPDELYMSPANANIPLSVQVDAADAQYQWRLNGVNIADATNLFYLIANAQPVDSGTYNVVIANRVGATNTRPSEVIIEAPALSLSDNFAGQITLSSSQFLGRGSNRASTREPGERDHLGRSGGKSVWISWLAPANGLATFHTRGSSFDTVLAIYEGGTIPTLALVAGDDERGGFHTSLARFNATQGKVYRIAIDGFAGQSGTIVLTGEFVPRDSALPQISVEPESQTAPLGGDVTFRVTASGATSYQWFFHSLPIPGATNSALSLTKITLDDLGSYLVEAQSDKGLAGSLPVTLEIGAHQAVVRDRLQDLLEISQAQTLRSFAFGGGFPTVAPGSIDSRKFENFGATTDLLERNYAGAVGGVSQWFKITSGGLGRMIVDTIGSKIDTVLAVFSWDGVSNPQLIAEDNNSAPDGLRSRVSFDARSGAEYFIVVDGVNHEQGQITLNWGLGAPPVVSPDVEHIILPANGSTTLSVSASGTPPPRFHWKFNNLDLSRRTDSTLSLSGFDLSKAGNYSVLIENELGQVTKTFAVELERPAEFRASQKPLNGSWKVQLFGNARLYILENSLDLRNWTASITNRPVNGVLEYTDTTAPGNPLRFYRARVAP